MLADHGLAPRSRASPPGRPVPVTLVELPRGRYDESAEATAYYVVAEAVANAQKHARAASVRVRVASRHGRLDIEIADDGIGGAAETPGSGLQGLRDRVEAVGGSFAVDSTHAARASPPASRPRGRPGRRHDAQWISALSAIRIPPINAAKTAWTMQISSGAPARRAAA